MGAPLARFVVVGTASLAFLTGQARWARAQEPCAQVAAPPDLPEGWTEAVQDLTRALAELPSTECRPVILTVEPAGDGWQVVVEAPDGRRAARAIAQPSLLVPIALGLVISVPRDVPPDAPHTSSAVSTPTPGPSGEAAASTAPPTTPGPHAGVDVSSTRLGVWLGLAVGARVGVPSTVAMPDVEARADLRVDRLLLFVSFRNVPVGFVAGQGFDGDGYRESSIAFGVGRGFVFGRYLLDVSLAPSLVTMRLSEDTPVHAKADDVELRVGVSARLNIPLSPSWRLTLAADTDVIPDFLRSEERVDPLPAFPSWTSGLHVGILGAVL
jgi:hypothetical protein